ncbi:hypothetical protein LEP1GSC193_4208 [Leptospira alstonii serovar Pingchang str. 80-412]|uniref:Uncharacterized protein n=2 Tax=Leptospira alstonii TaxID=28452 RepID=M6CRM3_9LEPT|nr:hypothetical protein LEP1GSC194_1864 [Leptospira alstonii serovar Sichuan str. 79601]EQA78426.1 hypothetical protein LEP1GSC193_4208 [Leptospira alstonii serovar Pingchang str. 80-412]
MISEDTDPYGLVWSQVFNQISFLKVRFFRFVAGYGSRDSSANSSVDRNQGTKKPGFNSGFLEEKI